MFRGSIFIHLSYSQANSSHAANHQASDEALRLLTHKPQCAYLSVTDSGTAYGSSVVGTVLAAAERVVPAPQLITMPVDSHHLMSQGKKVSVICVVS